LKANWAMKDLGETTGWMYSTNGSGKGREKNGENEKVETGVCAEIDLGSLRRLMSALVYGR